jgi:hypothetical protein
MKRKRGSETPWKCDECEAFFASKQRLTSHQQSPTACTKHRPPPVLECPCGTLWNQRGDAFQVAHWTRHCKAREEAEGRCTRHILCPLCNVKVTVKIATPDSEVCVPCQREADRVHMPQSGLHPILMHPFGNPMFTSRLCAPERGLELFDGCGAGNIQEPVAANEKLREYQKNAIRFCRHSNIWEAIKRHSRKCKHRTTVIKQFTCETVNTPMLREKADCFYWLFLSRQAFTWSHTAPTDEQISALPDVEPARIATERSKHRDLLLRLTTHDAWNARSGGKYCSHSWRNPVGNSHVLMFCSQ